MRERKPRTNLPQVQTSIQNMYLVYTPKASFISWRIHEAEAEAHVQKMSTIGYNVTLADLRFVFLPMEEVYADARLHDRFESDGSLLCGGYFDTVWFFGGGLSDFTQSIARLAAHRGILIQNRAENGSVLDRYLQRWILPYYKALHVTQ